MNYNVIEFAYIGDAYFELKVRTHLLLNGMRKVDKLQTEAKNFSSASGQAKIYEKIKQELKEEEIDIFKRARNNKRNYCPKNTDLKTYKISTGLEAIIGYLFVNGKQERLDYLFKKILSN